MNDVVFTVDLRTQPSAETLYNALQSNPDYKNYFQLQNPGSNLDQRTPVTSKLLIDRAFGVGTENLLASYGRVRDLAQEGGRQSTDFNFLYGIDLSGGVNNRQTLDSLSRIVDDPTYRATPRRASRASKRPCNTARLTCGRCNKITARWTVWNTFPVRRPFPGRRVR